ncbi:MAG: glycosyltransferase, partial [Afipia sp.]|nr:glycosyltransferase [Afipia sp.]
MKQLDLAAQRGEKRPRAERVIAVSPAAPGGKGDEGMLLGVLQILGDLPVCLLNPEEGPLWNDVLHKTGKFSSLTEHQGAFTSFLQHIRPTDTVLILGADVIDGTYGLEPALHRLDFLKEALARGARGVVACSFRSNVDQEILDRFEGLPAAHIFLRDVQSLENFISQVRSDAAFFPDLSYYAAPSEDRIRAANIRLEPWLSQARARDGKIVGLNFGEHMFRSFSEEHTDVARQVLVERVIGEILKVIPNAYFVLISNDNRRWPNFISDADYQHLAAAELALRFGSDRFTIYDTYLSYLDNIAVMRFLDLVITGRMHLAHAAVRQGTIPLIVMGSGHGHTSINKMLGMYATVFGTEKGVVSDIGSLETTIQWTQDQTTNLKGRLEEWIKISHFEENTLRPLLARSLGLSDESPSGEELLLSDLRARNVETALLLQRQKRLTEEKSAQAASEKEELLKQQKLLTEEKAAQAASEKEELLKQQKLLTEEKAAQAASEKEARDRLRATADTLVTEADQLAHELYRAYRRPWKPMRKTFQRGFIKLLLVFRPLLSKRTIDRLQRSIQKRKPSLILSQWTRFKTDLGVSADAQIQTSAVSMPARVKRSKIIKYRLLRLLAKLVRPFSQRQAEKFRRSADKRNPWRRNLAMPTSSAVVTPSMDLLDEHRRRRILVADYRLPRADTSAGERATVGLIADLCAFGYDVTFVPTDMDATPRYLEELQALGVEVITRQSGYDFAGHYIREQGGRFGAFYFIRVDVAEQLLANARQAAPDARIIFLAPDLYSLREGRAAALSGSARERKAAEHTKVRETAIMQAADRVLLVSPAEVPHLDSSVPLDKVSIFPALYNEVVVNPPGYRERQSLFFIGGFSHTPNVGAVKWFVDQVWPTIHAALPDVEFHILGAEAPDDIVKLGERPGVRFVGYVADLAPVLATYRLSVVPLLFGAGIKGKLGSAMGAGIPSVITTIAAEGMSIKDGVHAFIRDEPAAFAEATIRLYQDEALWNRLVRNGRLLVEDNFSEAANQASLLRVLDRAGALPLDLYVEYCQNAAPASLPDTDPEQAVDVSIIIPAYNQWNLTRCCLNSVLRACRATGIACEVILADDASSDETRRAAEFFPGLRVVRQEQNLGFLRNCNAAAAHARGRFLLFLNNDTVVMPNWLTALMEAAKTYPDAAILGSKLLYPDGTIQDAGAALFENATAFILGRGRPRHEPQFCFDREVDYVTGASALISRAFWDEVGGFDERYAPAYCEDPDIAMAARAHGCCVIFVAGSEVVHFEHSSYGAQLETTWKIYQTVNTEKLLEKWSKEFAEGHLPVSTSEPILAANGERTPSQGARERRRQGRLNILYFSPFPSHPDNHGNHFRIQSLGHQFKQLGHKVHFALLNSHMFDDTAVQDMRKAWDSFDILHNTCPLGADGNPIPFDHWYQDGLGEEVATLCHKYDIDLVFCSYVFQSKLLEYVPAHILKVIDTHDKMGDRY